MNARLTNRFFVALTVVAVTGAASVTAACPHALKDLRRDFDARKAQATAAYKAAYDARLYEHKDVLAALRHERKHAVRLCGPARAAAIKDINCRRRDAVKYHAHAVREMKATHVATKRALDAEYHVARKSLKCACNTPPVVVTRPVSYATGTCRSPRSHTPNYRIESRRTELQIERGIEHRSPYREEYRENQFDRTIGNYGSDAPRGGVNDLLATLLRIYAAQ